MFAQFDAQLGIVLEDLRRLEPIFHTAEFGMTVADFERRMVADYWEVGASGRRYNRQFILRLLGEKPPVDAEAAGWSCSDFGLRRIGSEAYLLTYTLRQKDRITRRATLWQKSADGWQILFHQGTIVAREEEAAPGSP